MAKLPWLASIRTPADLKKVPREQLAEVASELREKIVRDVSRTGGHLASSLGVVELTIALHYVFDCPEDRLVWDVGHQAYAHKILTGRATRSPGSGPWAGSPASRAFPKAPMTLSARGIPGRRSRPPSG
jgi:1-deoxy-D-xylulose-5-phosphate synthase